MTVFKFVPLNVNKLSDREIGERLQDMGEDFPYSGTNYDSAVLKEALRRVEEHDKRTNRG